MDQQEAVRTVRIVVDSSGARAGGAEVEGALKSISDKIDGLQDSIGSAFNSIKNFALGFLSFEAITDKIKDLREQFDGLASKASTLGVTVEWFQAFQYAAASSSVKLDAAENALNKYARTVGEAALGNKAAVDTMNDLGIKIYDAGRNVRPVSDLFVEAAQKLDGMQAGAKQNALAIQAMGKEAQAVIPMLGKVAQGSDAMSDAGKKAGAMVSREAVQIWEDLATAADKSMLKWRAFAGENFATTIKTGWTEIAAVIGNSVTQLNAFIGGMGQAVTLAKTVLREKTVNDASGALQENRANQAKEQAAIAEASKRLESARDSINGPEDLLFPSIRQKANITAFQMAAKDLDKHRRFLGYYKDSEGGLVDRLLQVQTPSPDAPPPVGGKDFGMPDPAAPGPTTGVYGATALDRGIGDRLNKRVEGLKAEAQAQKDMAAAALQGVAAVREQESQLKATQQALEVYGDTAKATDPQVQALAKTFKDYNEQIAQSKELTQFRLQTDDLERQNDVLQRRLELINAAPEVAAREIALLQVQNDIKKTGVVLTQQDIDARTSAVEKQELLNQKLQDTQRQQEIWMQPWKNFISNVQSSFSNFFEQVFNGGISTWKSLTDGMRTIFIKLMAELAAVAIIRPVLSPIVQGITSAGLISPTAASQLGYGSAGGVGGGYSSLGGTGLGGGGGLGGLSSLGSSGTGWLARQINGVSDFLSSPVSGLFSSVPAGGFSNVGDLISSGKTLASSSAGGGMLGGLSVGNVFSGIGSIGMGAYSLLSGKGGVGSTIGGIAQIAGGAMMMVPGLQPFGAVLSLLGGLGGLFGGGEPQKPPQPPLNYSMGNFAPTASGTYGYGGDSLNGGSSMSAQGQSLGSGLLSMFSAAGLKVVPGQLIGGELAAGVDSTWNGSSWQSRPYTQVGLINPQGALERLTYNDSSMNSQQAADYLFAQAFKANVLRGGVSGASDSLKTALQTANPTTQQNVQDMVSFTATYDKLGKATNTVKDALDKLNTTFASMTQQATTYGLALQPIADEQAKETKRTAQDFIDNMLDPLAVQMRALNDERDSAIASAQYIKDNISGVFVDLAKITDYYTKKATDLSEQYWQTQLGGIENLIKQLTYGSLSGASPLTTLTGVQASYQSTLAQASAGSATGLSNLAGVAGDYVTAARGYYGSSSDYYKIVADVTAALQSLDITIRGGSLPGNSDSATPTPDASAYAALITQLQDMVNSQSQQIQQLADQVSNTNSLLLRKVVNG